MEKSWSSQHVEGTVQDDFGHKDRVSRSLGSPRDLSFKLSRSSGSPRGLSFKAHLYIVLLILNHILHEDRTIMPRVGTR